MRTLPHDGTLFRFFYRTAPIPLFTFLLYIGICTAEPVSQKDQENKESVNQVTVECLLPSQMRSVGQDIPTLAPQRQVTVTAEECKERGGEIIKPPAK